jgi:hypothetical protein
LLRLLGGKCHGACSSKGCAISHWGLAISYRSASAD